MNSTGYLRRIPRRGMIGVTLIAALGLSLGVSAPAAARAGVDVPQTVHVRADRVVTGIRPGSTGADVAVWNPGFNAKVTAKRIRQAGIRSLDFDAGGVSDLYDWRTNTLRPDPDAVRDRIYGNGLDYNSMPPTFSFDKFEAVAKATGASTTVHVNYGTGTPGEAAAWVAYANRIKHDHVHNWIIGEEVYLDQYLEPDRRVPHTKDGLTKTESASVNAGRYARNVIAFSRAMKAVDPSIHIGVELFAADPAWFSGLSISTQLQYYNTWSQDVAATPGLTDAVDFADIHWLGSYNNPDFTIGPELASVSSIAPALNNLRHIIGAHTRPERRIKIIAGEVNSAGQGESYSATQDNAAYLADTEFTLLENGASHVQWFSLYTGLNDALAAADIGLLSTGNCKGKVCEPPAGTPFPDYYAMQLVDAAAQPGGRIVAATSTGTVAGHAVRRPDGSMAVLLINRGASNATVRLSTAGYRPRGRAAILRSSPAGIARSQPDPHAPLTLGPYAVALAILHH